MGPRQVHCWARRLPALGGCLPRRLAQLAGHRPSGGFDAVIGNPPWDRIEQQEVEWFAIRDNEVALASTGAMRKALIRRRMDEDNELALAIDEVRNNAATVRALARTYSDYPLLSGGRINLYSLFVERAMSLVKPDGFVGLLTPSGIYADSNAANFFKSVSTSGRLAGLFDFENRRLGSSSRHSSSTSTLVSSSAP